MRAYNHDFINWSLIELETASICVVFRLCGCFLAIPQLFVNWPQFRANSCSARLQMGRSAFGTFERIPKGM